jgi:hypothetical protein
LLISLRALQRREALTQVNGALREDIGGSPCRELRIVSDRSPSTRATSGPESTTQCSIPSRHPPAARTLANRLPMAGTGT